jgi:hypothetical protein
LVLNKNPKFVLPKVSSIFNRLGLSQPPYFFDDPHISVIGLKFESRAAAVSAYLCKKNSFLFGNKMFLEYFY